MMRRVERIPESIFGLENSSVDTNRFYSILLDAKAVSVSENMCDIAEKLLQGEKDNAKIALEQLWNLKKNLLTDSNSTVDLLINFYQDKMDLLRNKEEHIRKISRDSRNLLEEKRKRDEEFASIKQQLVECNDELRELTSKLEKLKTKEQELLLIEQQLKKELNTNENEIVNGLYEIIITQTEENQSDENSTATIEGVIENTVNEIIQEKSPQEKTEISMDSSIISEKNVIELNTNQPEETNQTPEHSHNIPESVPQIPPFPKSVVKTTSGRVIGEYYYDGTVYKNKRHYIFNSRFFYEQLSFNIKLLKQRFDQSIYSEVQKIIEDAHNRISENSKLHFEVSTNEILNQKNLKKLWHVVKCRDIDEVERFSNRLKAKIEMLGYNYTIMLQEQMKRCDQD